MSTVYRDRREPLPVLAMRATETAAAIGISVRKLRQLTIDGEIPHVALGTRIVYPVDRLRDWINSKATARRRTDVISPSPLPTRRDAYDANCCGRPVDMN